MILKQAKRISDWQIASEILRASIKHLNSSDRTLWTEAQVSIASLKSLYQLEELHIFFEEKYPMGVVFFQISDPVFWPEEKNGDSIFFHKLAIHPDYLGMGNGAIAIKLIVEYATKKDYKYVRLDCDDREGLKAFYLANGFSYVSSEQKGEFKVVKYELLTSEFQQS